MASSTRRRLGALHHRLGSAGLVLACIALIFALAGGAYAASGGLTGKQKKEVKKIAKSYAGKPGAQGPIGAQGPKGDPGPAGKDGAPGKDGINGTNGVDGTDGKDGSFSTEPLPEGETLTGVWSSYLAPRLPADAHATRAVIPIAFPIQVDPAPTRVIWVNADNTEGIGLNPGNGQYDPFPPVPLTGEDLEQACPGDSSDPGAAPGLVCVFASEAENADLSNENLARPGIATSPDPNSGVVIPIQSPGEEEGFVTGSWAVTAE